MHLNGISQVERLALHLLALGVQPLDRFVMQLPNGADFVFFYFALQKVGAIPVISWLAFRLTMSLCPFCSRRGPLY
jgi:non-ribosomal peptide synthetase component E (peptide arylation enzyme)